MDDGRHLTTHAQSSGCRASYLSHSPSKHRINNLADFSVAGARKSRTPLTRKRRPLGAREEAGAGPPYEKMEPSLLNEMASRARPHAQHLFNKYDFYSLEEHKRGAMLAGIDSVNSESIGTGDVEEMAQSFAEQYALDSPTLIEGALSIAVNEAQIDVTGNILYGGFGPGPTFTQGIDASYFVPFSGDADMFNCRASTRNLGLRPVELGKEELIFTYLRTDQDVKSTKEEFDKEIVQVKQSLDWLSQDCKRFNASLPAQARERVAARKARLKKLNEGIGSLGVPIRRSGAHVEAESPVRRAVDSRPAAVKKPEYYDIALSFAGEDRAYVEEVATGLRNAGVHVFYDKFESAQLWGKNLIDHLAEIYQNSRYVVMFISKAYVEKAWTNHERKHAQDRSLFAQQEYILPARFDDTPVPGMTATVAFQDLRHIEPTQLVVLILAKLGH